MRATVASLDRRCVAAAEAAGERLPERERERDRPIDTEGGERAEAINVVGGRTSTSPQTVSVVLARYADERRARSRTGVADRVSAVAVYSNLARLMIRRRFSLKFVRRPLSDRALSATGRKNSGERRRRIDRLPRCGVSPCGSCTHCSAEIGATVRETSLFSCHRFVSAVRRSGWSPCNRQGARHSAELCAALTGTMHYYY